MKRRAHRKEPLLGSALGGDRHRALDRRAVASDHDLRGRVDVGDADDLALGGFGADGLDHGRIQAHDRRHRARADRDRLLHELPAPAHEPHGIGEAKRAGDDECRVLAQAVPGRHIRSEPALGARGSRRDTRGQDRGLRVGGQQQLGLGPREGQPRQIEPERLIRLDIDRSSGGRGLCERPSHADRLRPLPREQKRDFHSSWVRAPGLSPARTPPDPRTATAPGVHARPVASARLACGCASRYHRTSAAPQVKPPPKAAMRMRSPGLMRPSDQASSSATYTEAAPVLP